MQWIKLSRVITYTACVLLAACGSEQNNDEVASIIDGSGAPVPDVAVSGAITGFGSVVVDGVHYQTDNAEVYINGVLSSEELLSVGDFITLLATEDDSNDELNASVIYAESAVQGKVLSINYSEGTLDVLNQRVRISGDTVFDANFAGSNITNIAVGEMVEIKGANTGSGDIYATRINKRDGVGDVLSGRISDLDTGMLSFFVAGREVDYSQASVNFPLAVGQWVSVNGSVDSPTSPFVATTVRDRKDRNPLAVGVVSRLEGEVKNVSPVSFDINGQVVKLTAETEYQDGIPMDLFDGAVVIVISDVDAQGDLQARAIRFRDSGYIVRDGLVGSIDLVSAPGEFGFDPFNIGSLTVGDDTFILNVYTIIMGRGQEFDHQHLSFGDIRLGDSVRVTAVGLPGSGEWLARVVDIDRAPRRDKSKEQR